EMIEEASSEKPRKELVEELCSAIGSVTECIALSQGFRRSGLDKRRWYNHSILSSADTVAYQCSREEAGPPPLTKMHNGPDSDGQEDCVYQQRPGKDHRERPYHRRSGTGDPKA
ncbi:MAG: hypothetical protein KGH50_03665, partial [Candidatus Micrarchaeota archaeon]|nr:hypothetical protein [Candidatus Micrarchaeota archaeon]